MHECTFTSQMIGMFLLTFIFWIHIRYLNRKHRRELDEKDHEINLLCQKKYELHRKLAFVRRRLKDSCDETGFGKYWNI